MSHTRSIVLKNTLERKTNPLLHLTPNLNVLLPFNGSPALISKEAFEKNIAMAAQEGQRIRGLVIPLEELKAMLALPAEERNAKIARVSDNAGIVVMRPPITSRLSPQSCARTQRASRLA